MWTQILELEVDDSKFNEPIRLVVQDGVPGCVAITTEGDTRAVVTLDMPLFTAVQKVTTKYPLARPALKIIRRHDGHIIAIRDEGRSLNFHEGRIAYAN